MSSKAFDAVQIGEQVVGDPLSVTVEHLRDFAEAGYDYNALHLDGSFMESTKFGKTQFEGVIAHGLFNFSRITKMLTDWLWSPGGHSPQVGNPARQTRLSRRHHNCGGDPERQEPDRPGDWILLDIELKNQDDQVVVRGEAMAEYPRD